MERVVTVDVEAHPRFDSLDCFAYIGGQSYRLVKDPPGLQNEPHITRSFVAQALREFADYIEKSAPMEDTEVPDGRGDVRRWYREGRLKK